MREIKFRGKRLSNGEWVYGGYHKHMKYTLHPVNAKGKEPEMPEYAHLIITSGFSDWGMPRPIQAYEIDPETVGEYFQHEGENPQEICEGDICSVPSFPWLGRHEMRLEQGTLKFGIEPVVNFVGRDFEVHGNIHDNPELLVLEVK